MLSTDIQEFIRMIQAMADKMPENGIGCLLVPEADFQAVLTTLGQADLLLSPFPRADRVAYYPLKPSDKNISSLKSPAILVVTEEDYAFHEAWADALRDKAAYFLKVQNG